MRATRIGRTKSSKFWSSSEQLTHPSGCRWRIQFWTMCPPMTAEPKPPKPSKVRGQPMVGVPKGFSEPGSCGLPVWLMPRG